MVLEKENWLTLPTDAAHVITFAGLVGDGAPLIVPFSANASLLHPNKSAKSVDTISKKSIFSHWLQSGNPFLQKLNCGSKELQSASGTNGAVSSEYDGHVNDCHDDKLSSRSAGANHVNGHSASEEENEDLLADFIDEDSQLPSRISKPRVLKRHSQSNDEENTAQTGSSLCLLR